MLVCSLRFVNALCKPPKLLTESMKKNQHTISDKIQDIILGIESDLIVCEKIHKFQLRAIEDLNKPRYEVTIKETYRFATHMYNLHLERAIINITDVLFGKQISLYKLDNVFTVGSI